MTTSELTTLARATDILHEMDALTEKLENLANQICRAQSDLMVSQQELIEWEIEFDRLSDLANGLVKLAFIAQCERREDGAAIREAQYDRYHFYGQGL